ncbi:hypothetical protein ACP4OV_009805 [Aristida adscensionis]
MGGASRALSLSSLCATTLAAAAAAAAAKPPLPFLAPAPAPAHRALPLRLAAAAMSSSSSPSPSPPSSSAPAPAASGDAAAPAPPSASSAIDFLTLCYRLKTTKRAGWVRRGVQAPESVADHMYRMGVMALVAADLPGVDRDRCVKMAIVHDIAEAIVGDITPSDGVPKEEKSRREREALDHMCELLGGGSRAQEIRELWMEYENNASLEAKVVKDFDKVEMILQALEYEKDTIQNALQTKYMSFNRYTPCSPRDGVIILMRTYLKIPRARAGPRRVLPINSRWKFQTDIGKAWAAEIASRRK